MTNSSGFDNTTPTPSVNNSGLALIVYILYFVGYFTGITALIGVIIAYVKVGDSDSVAASHFKFQIRTFWIGLLYIVIGLVTSFILIGWFILVWWMIWSIVRNIKGLLAINDKRSIANPTSWMFG